MIHIRTSRLELRDLEIADCYRMHEMDTNPAVQVYLGGVDPPQTIDDTRRNIERIQAHYVHGFGRWAVIERESNSFIGWAGLKIETNVNGHEKFYDLGYRFLPAFWNQGYATEAARALVDYGFQVLKADKICAYIEEEAAASRRVLEKVGFTVKSRFLGDRTDELWLEIQSEQCSDPPKSI